MKFVKSDVSSRGFLFYLVETIFKRAKICSSVEQCNPNVYGTVGAVLQFFLPSSKLNALDFLKRRCCLLTWCFKEYSFSVLSNYSSIKPWFIERLSEDI